MLIANAERELIDRAVLADLHSLVSIKLNVLIYVIDKLKQSDGEAQVDGEEVQVFQVQMVVEKALAKQTLLQELVENHLKLEAVQNARQIAQIHEEHEEGEARNTLIFSTVRFFKDVDRFWAILLPR